MDLEMTTTVDCEISTTAVKPRSRENNLKVRARAAAGVVAGLRAQVHELEQQRDFLASWKPDSFVDVEFQGLDIGERVHAHKAVLASKSVELEAMFRADTEGDVGNPRVFHLDMSYEALKAFVTFFYTGRISSLGDHFVTLLEAAHKYKVPFLASVCEDSLVKNVTRDNAISTFDMAKKHCSRACTEAVVEKARRLGELVSFAEYKAFTESNAALVLEFYEQLTDPPPPSKKMKFSPETDDDTAHVSGDKHTETDEDESVDDEADVKTDRMPAAPLLQPPFGTPMYWHGAHIPFRPLGFHYPRGRRPNYDMSMMARPPYGIPAFVPPMLPRGFLGRAPAPALQPLSMEEEVLVGKKKIGVEEADGAKRARFPSSNRHQKEKRCLLRGVKTTHNKNKKFIATITVKGQHVVLGKCHTEEEAGRLYDRAAFVVGRKTNNELPDDMKEELTGIPWDDFVASLQELTALEKIHRGKMECGDANELDSNEEQGEEQEEQEQGPEQEQVLSDVSEPSFRHSRSASDRPKRSLLDLKRKTQC